MQAYDLMRKKLHRFFMQQGGFTARDGFTPQGGFTLIELLVVIGVIGVLAAVILAVLDPLEQVNRGRDSGRISTVAQIGRAIQSYGTSRGSYPTVNADWQTTLKDAGEIKENVSVTTPSVSCGTSNFPVGNICFGLNGTADRIVWTVLDSKNSKAKASSTSTPCGQYVIAMYSTAKGQAGLACVADPAAIPTAVTTLY